MNKLLNYIRTFSNSFEMAVQPHKRFFLNPYLNEIDNLPKAEENWKKYIVETISLILAKEKPLITRDDGGLYVGIAGIGYMFYHLSNSPIFKNEKYTYLKYANNYITPALKFYETHCKDPSSRSAFLLGNAGIFAVAAALYSSLDDNAKMIHCIELFLAQKNHCLPIKFLSFGGDEMLVGRAGYLAGALWVNEEIGRPVLSYEQLFEVCHSIVESGRLYVKNNNLKKPPLMYSYYDVEYLGAAHGLSGILQMLLSVPGFIDSDEKVNSDIKGTVDYLLSLQTPSGNFPTATDEIGRRSEADELVHWCHGASGVIYLMAKAYLVWKEDKYLQSCIKCGDLVWTKGLLRKGPGICHGVAGSGYAFLLLYRLTGDEKYIQRAKIFAQFMFSHEFKKARTPDCPYSLYEGLAGTVCFLADLLHPQKATFPFLNIF